MPLAIWLILEARYGVAFWVFVAAGISDALDGYIANLDPGLWLARAAHAKDVGRADSFRRIAEMLEEWSIHDGQRKVYRRLFADITKLKARLEPFDPPTLHAAFTSFAETHGIKPRDLDGPVRVAVTGVTVGFGLPDTFVLLGRGETIRRIEHALTLV